PFIGIAISSKLEWKTDHTNRKLILAALFHDITIKNQEIAKIPSLEVLKSSEFVISFSEEDRKNYEAHPIEAANLVKEFAEIPPDVDRVILEHHELPDGTGFPRRLNHQRINPLSAVFILSHLIADEIYYEMGKIDINYFLDSKTDFSRGNFKPV